MDSTHKHYSKAYLPKLKNNPGYLAKLGIKLVNAKGESIDANNIDWSKYSKGIPYKVMQPSGDNNALGIFKFNFNNPYAVYLHDTNQRYLFQKCLQGIKPWLCKGTAMGRTGILHCP